MAKGVLVDGSGYEWSSDCTHFVLRGDGVFDSGWEFKSDATDRAKEVGDGAKVYSAKFLLGKGILTKSNTRIQSGGHLPMRIDNAGVAHPPGRGTYSEGDSGLRGVWQVYRSEDGVVLGEFKRFADAEKQAKVSSLFGNVIRIRAV